MPPGGARPGSGRPKGSRDSPLVLGRTLTLEEVRAIDEDCAVIRARVRLAAWQALANAVENIGTMPLAKDRAQLLSTVLKYSQEPVPVTALAVQVNVDGQPRPSDVIRQRLEALEAAQAPLLDPGA